MKKRISLLLVLILLLAGCAVRPGNTTLGTVPDFFTQPPSVHQAASKPLSEYPGLPERDMGVDCLSGFKNRELIYSGEEMHEIFNITARGFSNIGLGIRLFVDGQPQPYKTAEDDTLRYMHTFYPEDAVKYDYEFIFTPVTGDPGETLEVYIVKVIDPEFFLGDGINVFRHTSGGYYGGRVLLTVNATPGAPVLPELPDRLLNWNISYREITEEEIEGWTAENLQRKIATRFLVNDIEQNQTQPGIYGVTPEDTVKVRYEVWGTPHVDFCFVIYMDNQPVSVLPEDRIDVKVKSGQVTVIEAELSLNGFDGSSVVNAVLAPRNYFKNGFNTDADLLATNAAYLSSAASYQDLLNGNS